MSLDTKTNTIHADTICIMTAAGKFHREGGCGVRLNNRNTEIPAERVALDVPDAQLCARCFPNGSPRLTFETRSEDAAEYRSTLDDWHDEQLANELSETAIIKRAKQIAKSRLNAKGEPLTSPAATRRTIDALIVNQIEQHREEFSVLMLDTRHHLLAFETLFTGTIDAAHVHPRIVVERALMTGAAAVIVTHNHPSGVAEPSNADLAITRRLRDALALIDVRLLDHFIVADGGSVSLAERGLV